MSKPLIALLSLLLAVPAFGTIVREDVEYDLPTGDTARGVLVYDDDLDAAPAVLVIPEWWGLTEYPIMRAEQLAEEGYVAFVADMYGDRRTTDDPQQAGQLAGAANQTGLAELAMPALELLLEHERVDGPVFAIGFCFGGSTVADLVVNKAPIDGAVSFHGGLSADSAPDAANDGEPAGYPPLLVAHGSSDPLVPNDALGGFVTRSLDAGVPLTLVNFPGAAHAFTNPEADDKNIDGVAYDPEAEALSMRIMFAFFDMLSM
jgi:dienelactone hydrolase